MLGSLRRSSATCESSGRLKKTQCVPSSPWDPFLLNRCGWLCPEVEVRRVGRMREWGCPAECSRPRPLAGMPPPAEPSRPVCWVRTNRLVCFPSEARRSDPEVLGGYQNNFLEASWGQGSEGICYGGGGDGGVSGIPVHPSDSLRRSPCVVTDPGDTTTVHSIIKKAGPLWV